MSDSAQLIGRLIDEGNIHLRNNNFHEAKACFEHVLTLDDTNLQALNYMGFIYYFTGEFEKGERLCRKTILAYPNNAYAHKGLGLHCAKLGRIDEARQHLNRAIELQPDFSDAYFDMACVLYENKCYDEAENYLTRGLPHAKSPEGSRLFERFLAKLRSSPRPG